MTPSTRAGGCPICRSCRSTSSWSCATSARASRCRSSPNSSAARTSSEVVNACDAGREGELIFAYLYEKAKAKKPVTTAVAELDDQRGDEGGVRRAAPGGGVRAPGAGGEVALGGRLDRGHERHARGHDPPAQLLRRRGVARARADAHARDHRPPRGGDQGVQARALLAGGCDVRGPGARGRSPPPASAPTSGTSRLLRAAPATPKARGSRPSRRRSRSWRRARASRARSPSWRRKSSARRRRCCTT